MERRAVVQGRSGRDALVEVHPDVDDHTHGAQDLGAEEADARVGIVEPPELVAELLGVQGPDPAPWPGMKLLRWIRLSDPDCTLA